MAAHVHLAADPLAVAQCTNTQKHTENIPAFQESMGGQPSTRGSSAPETANYRSFHENTAL